MIDPNDPPEVQIEKQKRIIEALIRRAEHGTQVGHSAYALFNSAIALQSQVWAKTKDLEKALHTLGHASLQLETSEEARREGQRNLADAVEAMESGFALFSGGQLQICNQLFRSFLPDLSRRIRMGMTLDDYIEALRSSRFLLEEGAAGPALPEGRFTEKGARSELLGIQGDRWFQITQRETESGNTVLLLTEVTRVIRRNRMEREALIDNQALFLRSAFDHVHFGVASFSREGVLLQANARFRSLLDLPIQLAERGTVWPQILSYLRSQRLFTGVDRVLDYAEWDAEVASPNDEQWKLRHASGAMLEVFKLVVPDGTRLITVRDTSAENAAMALLEERVASRTTDLTAANAKLTSQNAELTQTRQELTEARDKAEAAVRSKTRFLAAASHDLLQPVNAAKLFLSTLRDQAPDEMAETVSLLSRSFTALETQLNALLDISRLDSTGVDFSVSEFSMRNVLAQVEVATAPLAAQKGLDLKIVPSRHWVRSDQRYLTRSVQNLVLNAIQYTETGRVLLGCRRRGDALFIEVWDTGIGIAPEDSQRIFDAFTRIRRDTASDNMGLGLSIVEQACRQLGHPVTLRSTLGEGSMFRIEVPISHGARPADIDEIDVASASSDMDLIAAVVEDDPRVLAATTQRLEAWGASVLGADSTRAAEDLVKSIGIAPDIVIVDYHLGEGDTGVDAILALRAQAGAALPAIMITANRSEELQQQARTHDFTILTKPVPLTRLRPLIEWKVRAAQTKVSGDST